MSFVGSRGWVLGSVACGGHRCAALARSSDGGRSWKRLPAPPAHIFDPTYIDDIDDTDCSSPCVGQVKFVTATIGYLFDGGDAAYGKRALFLTTDGGHSWRRQPGGADAIVPAAGSVLRVLDDGGCGQACTYRLQASELGTSRWVRLRLPSEWEADGIALTRRGAGVAALLFGSPAGGGDDAHSNLWTSEDDGATWTDRYEPCQNRHVFGGPIEIDSVALSQSPDGTLAALCERRGLAPPTVSVRRSSDGGTRFRPGRLHQLPGHVVSAFAAATSRTVFVSTAEVYDGDSGGATYRSTNGGRTYTKVYRALGWLAFTTSTTGYGITDDERAVVTTTDAGRTWHAAAIP